jgi:predicted molibdopterin-dependent oxidoreductase YjgC
MTNSIADLAKEADVYFVIGSNTTEAHPVIAMKLKQAVRHRDAKIIVADPRRIDMVDHSALWVRQKPGTDVALLNGIMHVIAHEKHAEHRKFIAERTENYEECFGDKGFHAEEASK